MGSDDRQSAELEAQINLDLRERDPQALDRNGDGVIQYIMMEGERRHQDTVIRTEGTIQALRDGGLELERLDSGIANWDRTQAQALMAGYLDQYGGQVELVICNNDDMAYGAVMALQNAGYNHGEGTTAIPVFGVDATVVAKDLINNGYMVGTIKQDNVGMADAVATITANLIAGKENKFEGLNENYVIVDNWFVQIPYAVYTGE